MNKSTIGALFVVVTVGGSAFADPSIKEGRSASCSNTTLVCAFMKDGSVKPTSECGARDEGAIRVLPGDCFDAD